MGSGYAEPHRASRKMLIVLIESREFGPVFRGSGVRIPLDPQKAPAIIEIAGA